MNDQEIDKLLENIEFSAITDGLGFHHSISDKQETKKSLSQKANELDRDLKKHVGNLKSESLNNSVDINRGDLSPFYKENETQQITSLDQLINEVQAEQEVFEASSSERLGAWIIDIMTVAILTLTTLVTSFFAAEISLLELRSWMAIEFIAVLFPLYFILYFSLLDTTTHSTFGKRLFKITVTRNNKSLNLGRAFSRTLFHFISFALLGLPSLLKTQDKFFETKVLKR